MIAITIKQEVLHARVVVNIMKLAEATKGGIILSW